MKKSTIITILAFALGIIILSLGFILLTDNNISRKLFATTTTAPEQTPAPEPMDFIKEDVSQYITLGQYKGLDIEVEQIEISDEDVERQIELLLAQAKQFSEVKEGVIAEHVVFNFDYTGYLVNEDGSLGEKFEGGSSIVDADDPTKNPGQLAYIHDDTLMTISSSGLGSFIDGFAQGILGKSVGDSFKIDITFPENYSPELAGKKTVFEIKINYIAKTNFTEEWVKEYTKEECKNREEFAQYIKDNVNPEIENDNKNTVWSKITENATIVKIPQQQFDYIYSSFVAEVESYVAYSEYYFGQKLDFDGVLRQLGFANTDELKEYANEVIKADLVIYAIIQAEDLEVTDEEYEIFIKELIEKTGKSEEETVKHYGGKDAIIEAMLIDEASKLILKENNLIVKE